MSEFQEKVDQFKQTFSEPGFSPGEGMEPSSEPPVEEAQEIPEVDHKPKRAKKRIESFKNRIDQLTFENNVRETQNRELLSRIQEQERILAEKQQQLEQNEQYKNAYYENNLQTQEHSVLNELKVSKEEGDVEKEIGLSKELARIQAEKATYNLYKSQLRNQPAPSFENDGFDITQKYYPSSSAPVQEEPENEVYGEWLERNPWADPSSSKFSPRLREEINHLDTELSDYLRYNGNSEIIGSPEYFSALDNIMNDKYGVGSQQRSSSPSIQGNNYSVAPVSRNGSSMADQYMSNNPNHTRRGISLSEDEYKIARNLQIKLPNGRYLTGDEAVKRYAEAKRGLTPGSTKIVID